jgi:hypothetical protein
MTIYPPGEVVQPPQGCRVDPLGVVDDEHERPFGSEVGGQPVEAMDRREAGAGGLSRARRVSEHRLGERGGSDEHAVASGGVAVSEVGLEELAHDAERELTLELATAGGADRVVARPGSVDDGAHEACLTDAGWPLHREDASASVRGLLKGLLEPSDLLLAFEEITLDSDHPPGRLVHAVRAYRGSRSTCMRFLERRDRCAEQWALTSSLDELGAGTDFTWIFLEGREGRVGLPDSNVREPPDYPSAALVAVAYRGGTRSVQPLAIVNAHAASMSWLA